MASLVKVAAANEIAPGSRKIVEANKEPISVMNVKGKFFAVRNVCLHKGGPVGEGPIDEEALTIQCPWHGWTYSLKTGANVKDPAKILPTYKVVVKGNDIFLEM